MAKKEEDKKEPLYKRAIKKVGDYAKEEIAHQKRRSLYNDLGKPLHRKAEEKAKKEEAEKYRKSLPSKKTHSFARQGMLNEKMKEKGFK